MGRDFEGIENVIGYEFQNGETLREALTHSSSGILRDDGARFDYERLEFIGDAMLDAIIGVMLYERIPAGKEGDLTKLRAQVVCESSLNRIGHELGIGEYLIMGEAEEKSSGRNKPSVIADAVEAIIGAIFIDGGYSEAEAFVERVFSELIAEAIDGKLFRDFKTRLQETAHKNNWHIEYVSENKGPDHDKTFFASLKVNGKESGYGIGKSKKEAEQNAAEDFLRKV